MEVPDTKVHMYGSGCIRFEIKGGGGRSVTHPCLQDVAEQGQESIGE